MKNKIEARSLRYDLAVFIGRFAPFHKGHLHVVEEALKQARTVLILVGSANEPRIPDRLPFTSEERREMISDSLDNNPKNSSLTDTATDRERVIIKYIEDYGNKVLWGEQVRKLVTETLLVEDENPFKVKNQIDGNILLIGHKKDNTSSYLNDFPEWELLDVQKKYILSATDIRDSYFRDKHIDFVNKWEEYIPYGTASFLYKFQKTPAYQELVAELRFMEVYLAQWDTAPYGPNFLTVDNVVIHQSSHILLIQRKSYPGKNLWALPGGHLERNETVDQGTLRELREETRLKVPEPILKGSIVATKHFDNPYRSMRHRTLTFATLFYLNPKAPERILNVKTDGTPNTYAETEEAYRRRVKEALALPKVTARSDAKRAKWVRLDSIRRDQMFEDHFSIIMTMKSLIKDE